MLRIMMTSLLFLQLLHSTALSQHENKEGCHVYVVDVEKAKAFEDFTDAQLKECQKNPEKCGIRDFPNFIPKMGEEELTTQTYKFPWAPLTITATVFITDEMWMGDSATLTITLAQSSPKDVQADENSAQTDIVLNEKGNAARVKRYFRVRNRQYLVGLECLFGKLK